MFAAYRYWAPRFEAAAQLNAALALVPQGVRSLIEARIDLLTGVDTECGSEFTDAARLRRETLALIRSLIAFEDQ
ncbi:MAG: hypothetical protein ACREU2_16855 [Steroidobacteraceae bacterium]